MMRYSISFTDEDYQRLTTHLFATANEAAAYLLCRPARSENALRLLVRDVIPVEADDIISASTVDMNIKSRSFLRVMKRADLTKQCFVFTHSHLKGICNHSPQDDAEERKLFRTAYVRISAGPVHGSIVFSAPEQPSGRMWMENGSTEPIERVRVIGNRFRFYFNAANGESPLPIYDRQVRAFGRDFQRIVRRLHIGVVGAGGTGSAVIEQLIRVGVGEISIFDAQALANTNVTRVYGSRLVDVDVPKVKLMERLAAEIGLGTVVHPYVGNITTRQHMERLKDCDIVFCCTDDQWGRSLLTRFSEYYYVPVIDMGVKIDSQDGVVHAIQGRVTVLVAGAACLFCRGRISPDAVSAESIQSMNPEEAAELRRQRYIPELEEQAPAVIPFTTTVAASAVTEFAHRLTGFMGPDRTATEIIHLIDAGRVRTNSTPPDPNCPICGSRGLRGRGDVTPLLDCLWPD